MALGVFNSWKSLSLEGGCNHRGCFDRLIFSAPDRKLRLSWRLIVPDRPPPMKSPDELKFLLTLLGQPDYRAFLSANYFDRFKKGKNQLCQALSDRGWVDCSREIATVLLLPAGRSLLELDAATLPIDSAAWKVLQKLALESGKVSPVKIVGLKVVDRQTVLASLGERGFVELEWKIKREKAEVWLTPEGLEYLREDYVPAGKNPTLSLDLLKAYIQFLRKSQAINPHPVAVVASEEAAPRSWSDDEILQAIRALDTELATENYLPIFHLRQKLGMARNDLDQALYRLQKTDRIELSSLQETDAYTAEQIDTGIPQNVGGPLFFISLN